MLDWIVHQDITPGSMSALQYRHEAPPRHGAMCRGPSSGGLSGRWVLSEPCQYFPCPILPTILLSDMFLLRALTLLVIIIFSFFWAYNITEESCVKIMLLHDLGMTIQLFKKRLLFFVPRLQPLNKLREQANRKRCIEKKKQTKMGEGF